MTPAGKGVVLEEVTPENYESVLALKVAPEQERFVAPVVKSLADAFVHQGARARVALEGDLPVGFILVFPFEKDGVPVVNVARLLIDERHQGRGLGRASMLATLEWIRSFSPRPRRVRISTLPDNAVARSLYCSLGFEEGGMEEGESASWLELGGPAPAADDGRGE